MSRSLLAGLLVVGLAACSGAAGENAAAGQPANAPGNNRPVSSRPVERRPTELTLAAGTSIQARIQDSISSRHNQAGETVTAIVSDDVRDRSGQVVIPAGSAVKLRIALLQAATNRSQADGKIALDVTSVTVRGREYSVGGRIDSVPHVLQGRGVTAGEVEKVGGGAAIGAVAGRIIGGDARGTVIGGAVGAAAGTAVAAHWSSRDVVVARGTAVEFSLPQATTIAMR